MNARLQRCLIGLLQHPRWAMLTLLIAWLFSPKILHAVEIRAVDFGLVADGKTDDAPAIFRVIAEAKKQSPAPVTIVFPKKKTIFAAAAEHRYLFYLRDATNLTIDGGGSTFLLDPRIRMADLRGASTITMKNMMVDYTSSMFIETIVQEVHQEKSYLDVRPVDATESNNIRGATKEDGEQWFGGFVWCENGSNPKAARHFSVGKVERLDNGLIRIFHGEGSFTRDVAKCIIPGITAFSMPRSGVAHRHGPGALFEVHDVRDARLEHIHVWSAPWFAFSIYRCEGFCRFHDVDVVPKPHSARRMSSCRDAFHVTANRARISFEHCDTRGTGDDDYNFCILSSTIRRVISPTEIVIRQKFPIQYNPMREGDTIMLMDSSNSMIGSAKIARYTESPLKQGEITPGGSCPEVTVRLDTPITGLRSGLTAWSREACNPNTTMSHCTAAFSIRMQTSLTIKHCRFECYNISYGMSEKNDNVEGPGPEFMRISHCQFHRGRGAGYHAQCDEAGSPETTRLQSIEIDHCFFYAPLKIAKANQVVLTDNTFEDKVTIGSRANLLMSGNRLNDSLLEIQSIK
ncbi:MAG: hypothetical protein RLZZ553_703 [Verrucomicrobiota bacterium]